MRISTGDTWKTYISEDFLLYNDVAKSLYHEYAKHLPIIDYHSHLDPEEIYENKQFSNLTEIWLGGDHYKWRAMRANGISEEYITGSTTTDEDKFLAWAETVPNLFGNPLYHWTHLELLRYFEIDVLLNRDTAPSIWKKTEEQLKSGKLGARELLDTSSVEFVGTTDDPTDHLEYHEKLANEDISTTVAPSFRPDQALSIEKESFYEWVEKLEGVSHTSILNYSDFIDALVKRIDFFHKRGCRISDHGINSMFYQKGSLEQISSIFEKRLTKQTLTHEEIHQFKTYTLLTLAERYKEYGWVMQLHIGPLRNNNTKMYHQLGPDSGFDSMGDQPLAEPLSRFLDALEQNDHLPKTIMYGLNPNDNYILATMAGNFQSSEVPGKIQFGTAWWFNDHIDGMEQQMKVLANTGLIRHFVGMLTDSRSLLSFPRHEYFRRILCNLLGRWVSEGKVPNDRHLLRSYVEGICYANAKQYFQLT